MSENGNGTGAPLWTQVARQPKQKYCAECKAKGVVTRTFYWMWDEAVGAVCEDCVNSRNMAKPPAGIAGDGSAKKSRSYIAPAKRIAIIAKRAAGESKASISRQVHSSRDTVAKVLNEADFDKAVEQGRFDAVKLIPTALSGLEKSMNKGDGQVCNRFLENVGVLAEKSHGRTAPDQNLFIAINNLIRPEAKSVPAAIDAEVV